MHVPRWNRSIDPPLRSFRLLTSHLIDLCNLFWSAVAWHRFGMPPRCDSHAIPKRCQDTALQKRSLSNSCLAWHLLQSFRDERSDLVVLFTPVRKSLIEVKVRK